MSWNAKGEGQVQFPPPPAVPGENIPDDVKALIEKLFDLFPKEDSVTFETSGDLDAASGKFISTKVKSTFVGPDYVRPSKAERVNVYSSGLTKAQRAEAQAEADRIEASRKASR